MNKCIAIDGTVCSGGRLPAFCDYSDDPECPHLCPDGCSYAPRNSSAYDEKNFTFCTDTVLHGPSPEEVSPETCGNAVFELHAGGDHGCVFVPASAPGEVTALDVKVQRDFFAVATLCARFPLLSHLSVAERVIDCGCDTGSPSAPSGWCPPKRVAKEATTCTGNPSPADNFD